MNYLQHRTRLRQIGQDDEGFTLIELLIVIVVLGILAAVVVFALANVNHNAKQSACTADAKTIESAVGAYNAQNTPAIAVENGGADIVQASFTSGVTAGMSVVDTSGGPATTVISVIDGTHFSVPSGAASTWSNGDLLNFNSGATFHFSISVAPGGGFTAGTPSTYSSGTQAQLLLNAGLVKSWPGFANGYAISLSATKAGDVSIYVPATSTSPVDYETESSSTGCNNASL